MTPRLRSTGRAAGRRAPVDVVTTMDVFEPAAPNKTAVPPGTPHPRTASATLVHVEATADGFHTRRTDDFGRGSAGAASLPNPAPG